MSESEGDNENDNGLVKIGKSTDVIISDLVKFSSWGAEMLPTNMFDRNMQVTIQNGPTDVLLKLYGRQKYRLAHKILHSALPFCYFMCYDQLSCSVYPLGTPHKDLGKSPKENVELKLKWILRGCHKPPFITGGGESSKTEVLLEAYFAYTFDRKSGRLMSHVIDWVAVVPPVDFQLELERVHPSWIGESKGRVPGTCASTVDSTSSNQSSTMSKCQEERGK